MEIASCKPLYAVLAALIGSILVSMAGRVCQPLQQ